MEKEIAENQNEAIDNYEKLLRNNDANSLQSQKTNTNGTIYESEVY